MNFVVESERLQLRQFELSDVEEYYQMTLDPLIQTYVPFACEQTLENTYEAFEMCYSVKNNPYDFYLILENKTSRKIVGAIISTAITTTPLSLDVCIFTGAEYRRQGYMLEALLAFKDALPKSTKLIFTVDKENQASLNTIRKLPNVVETPASETKHFIRFFLTT